MTASAVVRLAVAGCALLAVPAAAQESAARPLRRVATSCRTETARLCPALQQSVPRPRDQVICLRPYRTSLSLGCRGAIDALKTR